MKRFFLTTSLASIVLLVSAQKHELVKKWESDTLLKVPESVLFDGANQVLYVTNIDGTDPWGKDGKGSVGKVGLDGKIIAVEWIKGLNAPKGMALYNGNLYVADLSNVVVIDIAGNSIATILTIADAQGLNDVTVDKNGVLYVSDSKGKKVYRIENGKAQVYLENLKGPNGVLIYGNDFYLLDAGGMYKVGADKVLTKITEGMDGGTDGIENVTGNDFIVSCWAGAVWYVYGDGTKELLLDTREQKKNTADIGYDGKTRTVYVPTFWKNSVVAYELK